MPAVAFGCLLLTEYSTRKIFHDNTYYQVHGWPKLAGMWVAAGVVQALIPRPQVRSFLDQEAGKQGALPSKDTFFFIPLRYWPPIMIFLGVAFYFLRD